MRIKKTINKEITGEWIGALIGHALAYVVLYGAVVGLAWSVNVELSVEKRFWLFVGLFVFLVLNSSLWGIQKLLKDLKWTVFRK